MNQIVPAALIFGMGMLMSAADARSSERGIFLGGSLGLSEPRYQRDLQPILDTRDMGGKLFAGYRFRSCCALEAAYAHYGQSAQRSNFPDLSGLRIRQEAWEGFAVGHMSFAKVDAFAKAGMASWKSQASARLVSGPVRDDHNGTDFAWGIGVGRELGVVSIRLEYEGYDAGSSGSFVGDQRLLSVGVAWSPRR